MRWKAVVESSVAADEDERDTWHEMTEKEPGDKIQNSGNHVSYLRVVKPIQGAFDLVHALRDVFL